jgi:GNAT superfamily N-acetyltransferase
MKVVATPHQIVPCPSERLAEMFRLRATVWIGEGTDPAAFPRGEWRDERDASRMHWIALAGDRVVGTASLSIHRTLDEVEEGEVYVKAGLSVADLVAAPARVTVHADHRGRGLVDALLDVQDGAARAAGAAMSVRQASPSMRRILERRGWRVHGPGPWDWRFPTIGFTVMSILYRQ